MKVLFSNPPWWGGSQQIDKGNGERMEVYVAGIRAGSRWPFTVQTDTPPGRFTYGQYLPYPFFMGFAATYVARNTGADVEFRDSIALRETYADYLSFVLAGRFDYIVIESATPSWPHDQYLIRLLHRVMPHMRIVVVGPIASQSGHIMANLPVHACVYGEYEKGVTRVVQGETGVIGFDLLTLDEMNSAPFPYFDAVYAHRYLDSNPKGVQVPQAQVWSSRGCPYKCIFCVWPATMTGNDPDGNGKRSVRQYKPEYMEAFLKDLVGKYGFRSIYFDDDTFNLGDRHVRNMCNVMRKVGVPWAAMCRADTSSIDLWREMKESGCYGVKIGFESGSQTVIDNIINKRLDLQRARETVVEAKRVGLTVHGTFTFGLPGETREQMLETIRYADSLGLDTRQESGCAEIEGTPLHTLTERGNLSRYAGARTDTSEYLREADGRVKYAKLAAELAHSSAS